MNANPFLRIARGEVTATDVEGAIDDVIREEDPVIRTIWRDPTAHQQNVLRAVASGTDQIFSTAGRRRFGLPSWRQTAMSHPTIPPPHPRAHRCTSTPRPLAWSEEEDAMEARTSPGRWTYAEFARIPSREGERCEVIDGDVFVTPAPSTPHQRVVTGLTVILHRFVTDHGLGVLLVGPVDVLFGEGDYLEPDLVFVRRDRETIVSDRGIEGPPDLVVEVISPSTHGRDRGIKLDRYRHYGVAEYWIVDPERKTIEVWRLATGAPAADLLGADDPLRWTPVEGAATLDLPVTALFRADD